MSNPTKQAIARPKSRASKTRQVPKKPLYQAVGIVRGELYVSGGNCKIETLDGQTLNVGQIRDSRLLCWLLAHEKEWRGKDTSWMLYPVRDEFCLIGLWKNAGYTALKAGKFIVSGHVKAVQDGILSVKVGRNNPRLKGFSIVHIQGHLPGLNDGDIWRLQCQLEDGKLALLDGESISSIFDTL